VGGTWQEAENCGTDKHCIHIAADPTLGVDQDIVSCIDGPPPTGFDAKGWKCDKNTEYVEVRDNAVTLCR
jgi:hypothetical protein